MKTLPTAIVLAGVITWGCGERGPELSQPYSNPKVADRLVGAAPQTWTLAERKEDQVPWGHHWSDGYRGHGGTKLILVGPTPVNLHWQDQAGGWHEEPLARESLEVWILPAEYREGRWGFHGPPPAELVAANRMDRVYALPSHRLNSEDEFNAFLKKVSATSWPASPHNGASLSWKSWKVDLTKALGGA